MLSVDLNLFFVTVVSCHAIRNISLLFYEFDHGKGLITVTVAMFLVQAKAFVCHQRSQVV